MKICTKCKELKNLTEFTPNKKYKDGRCSQCRNCRNKYAAIQREKHRDKNNAKYRERYANDKNFKKKRDEMHQKSYYKTRKERPAYWMLKGAKQRANEKGLDFNLTENDIIIPEYCPILEIKLKYNEGKGIQTFNSPSIDRINSSKGYIKGNVKVISLRANMMKNDASEEELKLFCKNILDYVKNEEIVQTIENI